MILDLYLIPHTKINLKWNKDLNVKLDIIKLLEQNIGKKLNGICPHSDLLNITPKAQATRAKSK